VASCVNFITKSLSGSFTITAIIALASNIISIKLLYTIILIKYQWYKKVYIYCFSLFFNQICPKIAPNVPAVYDVWAGIKGLCEAKTTRPNVPE
jgi:hypothetical protein